MNKQISFSPSATLCLYRASRPVQSISLPFYSNFLETTRHSPVHSLSAIHSSNLHFSLCSYCIIVAVVQFKNGSLFINTNGHIVGSFLWHLILGLLVLMLYSIVLVSVMVYSPLDSDLCGIILWASLKPHQLLWTFQAPISSLLHDHSRLLVGFTFLYHCPLNHFSYIVIYI